MPKVYRKRVLKRGKGCYRKRDGVPQLAAQLAGVSVSMVYKVRRGKAVSAPVQRAIKEAQRRLRRQRAERAIEQAQQELRELERECAA